MVIPLKFEGIKHQLEFEETNYQPFPMTQPFFIHVTGDMRIRNVPACRPPCEGLNLFAGHDEGDGGADKDHAVDEGGRKGLVGVIRSGTATAKRRRKQFSPPFVF